MQCGVCCNSFVCKVPSSEREAWRRLLQILASVCERDIFILETLRSQIIFLMSLVPNKGKKWRDEAKMRSVFKQDLLQKDFYLYLLNQKSFQTHEYELCYPNKNKQSMEDDSASLYQNLIPMKPCPSVYLGLGSRNQKGNRRKKNYNTEGKLDESITEYFNRSGTQAMTQKVELQRQMIY